MQHSVASSGHRALLAGMWRGVTPDVGRHRVSATPWRRVFAIGLTLFAALVLITHVGWLAVRHANAARSAAASTTAQRGAGVVADDWIRANLPPGIHVLADGFDPPTGYLPVSLETAGPNWANYSYLLTTAKATPAAGSALATVWKSSIAVAVFDDVEVRSVLPPMSADRVKRDLDGERAERIRAGEALQHNSQLASSPPATALLARGELDLRAAAALTAIVSQVPVTLTRIVVVAAEADADMPARALTIYSSEPAAVTRALSGLASTFTPDQVTVGENGAIELHWPLSVTPMPSVN